MVKVYRDLILNGTINPKTDKPYTIDDVPDKIKGKVQALLGDTN
jgi:hypothetical protein